MPRGWRPDITSAEVPSVDSEDAQVAAVTFVRVRVL
jgi:hypothetical protein